MASVLCMVDYLKMRAKKPSTISALNRYNDSLNNKVAQYLWPKLFPQPKGASLPATCVYRSEVQIATDVFYAQRFGFLRRLGHQRRIVAEWRCLSPDS